MGGSFGGCLFQGFRGGMGLALGFGLLCLPLLGRCRFLGFGGGQGLLALQHGGHRRRLHLPLGPGALQTQEKYPRGGQSNYLLHGNPQVLPWPESLNWRPEFVPRAWRIPAGSRRKVLPAIEPSVPRPPFSVFWEIFEIFPFGACPPWSSLAASLLGA